MQFLKRLSQAKSIGVLLVVLIVSACVGCGSSSPFDYVKVSGKVTFDDGQPIKAQEVRVMFLPQDVPTANGPKPRGGATSVNVEDGTFDVVTSHRYGDGILPGEHRVVIAVIGPQGPSEQVAPEYLDPNKTPLLVNAADSPFDLKVKRLR